MKIGVFGYYRFGNFGDDLMAVLFAGFLSGEGHEVRVYGLDAAAAQAAGVEATKDLSGLVAWADVLVYGGGGVFLDNSANRALFVELDALLDARLAKGIPLYAISVGGDERVAYRSLAEPQKRLLREADFLTFRNPEDERLARGAANNRFEVYPDVVWTVGRHAAVQENSPRISLEFSGTPHKVLYYAAFALVRLLYRREVVDVVLSRAPTEAAKPGRGLKGSLFARERYDDVLALTRQAGASGIILTSRLHYGLAGLASGGTTFLIHPAGKARMLFERLGLEDFILDRRADVLRVILAIARSGPDAYPLTTAQRERINVTIGRAEGHFHRLSDLLADDKVSEHEMKDRGE